MIKWLLQIQFGPDLSGPCCIVVHVSVRICLGHNLYICAWISK